MFWRRRGDEKAWHVWQRLEPYANAPVPRGERESAPLLGHVQRVYQHGRRGDKAVVNFGAAGIWDTWWEGMRPRARSWVLVAVHLWLPPGTHSGEPVLWIDQCYEEHSGNLNERANRYARRLLRDQQRELRRL
jgi:hypothetical protein